MATCKFCGKPAGFWHFSHPDCRTAARKADDERYAAALKVRREQAALEDAAKAAQQEAETAIETTIANFSSASKHFADLSQEITRLVTDCHLGEIAKKTAIIKGLKRFNLGATEISLPRVAVVRAVQQMTIQTGVRQSVGILYSPVIEQLDQIVTLSAVHARDIDGLTTKVPFGMNIGKGERPLWSFPGTDLFEDHKHTTRVGGGRGVSVRVAKGVYLHSGHFKSHTRETLEHEKVDNGTLLFTDKALYFDGRTKSFKIPFNKIGGYEACRGGVEVRKDGVTAKPEYFITGDAWFTTNLLSMAINL